MTAAAISADPHRPSPPPPPPQTHSAATNNKTSTSSQSARRRHPTDAIGHDSSSPDANRAQPTSHHRSSASRSSNHSHHPPTTTRQRDIVHNSQYEHERTNLASHHRLRSTSGDRDQRDTAAPRNSFSGSHRRHSQRSSRPQPVQPPVADMASTVAHNAGPAPVQGQPAPDARVSGGASKARSRTTIPTQSGKWILGKTIGAGSMGKVKLAKKEDSSEQVSLHSLMNRSNIANFFSLLLFFSRSLARSFLEARQTTPSKAEQTRNVMITPRKSGPPERLLSSPYSIIPTFAAYEMSCEPTITGICSSSMSTAGRCLITSFPMAS